MAKYNINLNDVQNELVKEVFTNNFGINPEYLKAKHFFQNDEITLHQYEIKQNIKDDKSIIYKYNNDHFRCDNFIKFHKNTHVLFSGCSETEGVGANIEDNWSNILYNKLNTMVPLSGYFNLALAGNSFDKIINDIINYIDKFGNPDMIFILFPNIGRWYEWVDNNVGYQRIGIGTWCGKDVGKEYINLKIHRDRLIDFTIKIKLFELYCKTNNIDLYWSSWDKNEENNFKHIESINNFIYFNMANFENNLINETMNKNVLINRSDYFFRRDGHLGQSWNNYFAENFLNAIKENKNANIRI